MDPPALGKNWSLAARRQWLNNLNNIALNYRVGHCKSVSTVQPLECGGRTKRPDEDSQISVRSPPKLHCRHWIESQPETQGYSRQSRGMGTQCPCL